jgi:hypothetical protein
MAIQPASIWSSVRFKTTSHVLLVVLVIGAMTSAPAVANAEPHTYRLECLDYVGSGLLSPITDVSQCAGGLISFYDTYDNHLVGQIDAFKMRQRMGPQTSLQESYEACTANIICQIGIAALDTYILSKVRALYLIFKTLI